ncbi:hypothetical protein [Aureispira sp. CCB-QB1]|uniref:hypothetical protein n=1 Tax=Aureispira sp. CCB-QB1 TaxID=1313421 RepID=UPI0006961601|nr:hypothetical protein [Aureispira sp. CCB-QB1]
MEKDTNIATLEEEKEIIVEEVVEDTDYEPSFFANADQPREGFEVEEEEEEMDKEGEEPPKISETSEEDEQYFKIAMSFLDQTRAMGLSMFAGYGIENTDKYIFYKDWSDPKHKATLEAGRVVAKKYKLSAFQHLPELMLLVGIIASTGALFTMAKEDKKKKAQEDALKNQPTPHPQAANNTPTKEVQLKPFSKKAK